MPNNLQAGERAVNICDNDQIMPVIKLHSASVASFNRALFGLQGIFRLNDLCVPPNFRHMRPPGNILLQNSLSIPVLYRDKPSTKHHVRSLGVCEKCGLLSRYPLLFLSNNLNYQTGRLSHSLPRSAVVARV
jgi:hypothetical protein